MGFDVCRGHTTKLVFLVVRLPTLHIPVGDFRLPKFKLSASGSVRQVLRHGMGINSVFVAGEADLADKAAKRDEDAAGTPLYVADVCHKAVLEVNEVADVCHKAVLEVNEGGTVAIGATASYMLCGASAIMDQPVKVDFVADHPFVFFLIEEVSRSCYHLCWPRPRPFDFRVMAC